jgi:hypothetical protein
MDAVTYSNRQVADFINERLIAVRLSVATDARLAQEFRIEYTPTIVLLDDERREQFRSVGGLSPQELIAGLLLGEGKSLCAKSRFRQAFSVLNQLLETYPGSRWVGEAAAFKEQCQAKAARERV